MIVGIGKLWTRSHPALNHIGKRNIERRRNRRKKRERREKIRKRSIATTTITKAEEGSDLP
jgi:hypothetical protein